MNDTIIMVIVAVLLVLMIAPWERIIHWYWRKRAKRRANRWLKKWRRRRK